MKNDKNLISLKEASEISGYSSDYIGQLIRSGKIFGEQVYSNVVWMTTEDAVLDYRNTSKNKNSKTIDDSISLSVLQRRINIELNILKIFLKTFKTAFIILLLMLVLVIFLVSYIFYSFASSSNKGSTNIVQPTVELNSLKF